MSYSPDVNERMRAIRAELRARIDQCMGVVDALRKTEAELVELSLTLDHVRDQNGIVRLDQERLLTAGEVAERLGRSRDWVYTHADLLGCRVDLPGDRGRRAAMFYERGLNAWIQQQAKVGGAAAPE